MHRYAARPIVNVGSDLVKDAATRRRYSHRFEIEKRNDSDRTQYYNISITVAVLMEFRRSCRPFISIRFVNRIRHRTLYYRIVAPVLTEDSARDRSE